jgi:endonuclease/exonuclease/phosphatase family metal-dependent hydrolase
MLTLGSGRGAVVIATMMVLVVLSGCRAQRAATSDPLRVLVYNIHAGKDARGIDNIDRVAALIREAGAGVALLQEVDRNTRRSGNVDQVTELTRRTGMHAAFGKSLAFQGGDYGIAILSRWPIDSSRTVPLPIDPPQLRSGVSYEPRVALRAWITAPGGALHVVNTHMDASGDDRYRRQEIVTVLAQGDSATVTTLIGGDLNSTPESVVQQAVRDRRWQDAWTMCGDGGPGFTYPADSGVKRIDYLYLRAPLRCSSARVLQSQASDHRALLVEIRR